MMKVTDTIALDDRDVEERFVAGQLAPEVRMPGERQQPSSCASTLVRHHSRRT